MKPNSNNPMTGQPWTDAEWNSLSSEQQARILSLEPPAPTGTVAPPPNLVNPMTGQLWDFADWNRLDPEQRNRFAALATPLPATAIDVSVPISHQLSGALFNWTYAVLQKYHPSEKPANFDALIARYNEEPDPSGLFNYIATGA